MNRPKRVLLMAENLPIARDHRLRKQAAALVAAGFAVTVVCRRDPENRKIAGITLREYPAPPDAESKLGYLQEYGWSLLMASWKILSCLLAEGFDVIQVASTPDIYFILTLPLRALGKTVVFDARDLSPEIYARRYGRSDGLVFDVLRLLERASYRAAHAVLVVNSSVALVATERCGVPAERVTLVGNGPVLSEVRPNKPEPASSDGGLLCCWIGLMGPQDGVDIALRAVAQLVHGRGRIDTRFVFAGTGDALPALEALAAELHLGEWVSFPGWADSEQVANILRSAHVGLEPNLEDFVSPVKAMEYMVYGLPVVAFDLRETRRIVGSGGLYASRGDIDGFTDCIEMLLDNPQIRQRLGAVGKRRVRSTFAWEHQELRYIRLYENLLEGRREWADASQECAPV